MPKILCLLFCLLFCLNIQALAAEKFARNIPTSARDIEFFYKHQEPKTLSGIMRTLDREHLFAKGELRLTIAAFLAEILKKDADFAKEFILNAKAMSRDAKRMLLWALHLANQDNLASSILQDQEEETLIKHIKKTPTNLLLWDITKSSAVVHMYWGAFFAYADLKYVDKIIDAAILYTELVQAGRTNDPRYATAMAVCASLYDLAPRHRKVYTRLTERVATLHGSQAQTLQIILNQK